MSSAKTLDAVLPGYNGPLFSPAVERLQDLYQRKHPTGETLQTAGDQIFFFKGLDRPTTIDGYPWYHSVEFRICGLATITILFPAAQDWDKTDDTATDRHVAVYTQGYVNQRLVEKYINKFADALARATKFPAH